MEYSVLNLDSIQNVVEQLGLQFDRYDDHNMMMVHRPQEPERALRIMATPDNSMVSMAIVAQFKVPRNRVVEVSCAIAIANGLIDIGAWCFNYGESEVYYRLTVPSRDNSWNEASIRTLMEIVLGYSNLYFTKLEAIALADASFESILEAHSGA